ncbi:hypothetical protein ACFUJR_01300 [Streptomyces sp. NPDC057271]|uniref:WXG100-like domain-containing protein n=1 Tax=Streptomyces sp. NPDC057271 TaxID=3346078 RepID=UPI0036270774
MSLEFPPECAWLFAALTGEVPPNGDEDKLFALAELHKDLHGKLTNDLKQQISEALGFTHDAFKGNAAEMYQAAMKSFIGEEGLNYFDEVANQAKLLAEFSRKGGTQLQYTKYMIIAQLVELLVEAIVAAATSFFFGVSLQAYFAKVAFVRWLIRFRLGRLVLMLISHQIINVGMGVAMDALVQWAQLNQGTRDQWDTELTKQAALSGMIQGLLAGPFQFLGDRFGKGLANLFGKNSGKDIGNRLDEVFVPKKPDLPGPKKPDVPGPEAPRSFGGDLAKNFGDHIPKTAGPKAVSDKAAKDFVRSVGDTFDKHLKRDGAREAGENWARTLLRDTGKKDLPLNLENSLKPLGKELSPDVTKVLTRGTADAMGQSILRHMSQFGAHHLGKGLFEGAHAAVSEGMYNLIFSDEHTFKTSGLTFASGMVEGRVSNGMELAGERLGNNMRHQLLNGGMDTSGGLVSGGADDSSGSTAPGSSGGATPSGESSDTPGPGTVSQDGTDGTDGTDDGDADTHTEPDSGGTNESPTPLNLRTESEDHSSGSGAETPVTISAPQSAPSPQPGGAPAGTSGPSASASASASSPQPNPANANPANANPANANQPNANQSNAGQPSNARKDTAASAPAGQPSQSVATASSADGASSPSSDSSTSVQTPGSTESEASTGPGDEALTPATPDQAAIATVGEGDVVVDDDDLQYLEPWTGDEPTATPQEQVTETEPRDLDDGAEPPRTAPEHPAHTDTDTDTDTDPDHEPGAESRLAPDTPLVGPSSKAPVVPSGTTGASARDGLLSRHLPRERWTALLSDPSTADLLAEVTETRRSPGDAWHTMDARTYLELRNRSLGKEGNDLPTETVEDAFSVYPPEVPSGIGRLEAVVTLIRELHTDAQEGPLTPDVQILLQRLLLDQGFPPARLPAEARTTTFWKENTTGFLAAELTLGMADVTDAGTAPLTGDLALAPAATPSDEALSELFQDADENQKALLRELLEGAHRPESPWHTLGSEAYLTLRARVEGDSLGDPDTQVRETLDHIFREYGEALKGATTRVDQLKAVADTVLKLHATGGLTGSPEKALTAHSRFLVPRMLLDLGITPVPLPARLHAEPAWQPPRMARMRSTRVLAFATSVAHAVMDARPSWSRPLTSAPADGDTTSGDRATVTAAQAPPGTPVATQTPAPQDGPAPDGYGDETPEPRDWRKELDALGTRTGEETTAYLVLPESPLGLVGRADRLLRTDDRPYTTLTMDLPPGTEHWLAVRVPAGHAVDTGDGRLLVGKDRLGAVTLTGPADAIGSLQDLERRLRPPHSPEQPLPLAVLSRVGQALYANPGHDEHHTVVRTAVRLAYAEASRDAERALGEYLTRREDVRRQVRALVKAAWDNLSTDERRRLGTAQNTGSGSVGNDLRTLEEVVEHGNIREQMHLLVTGVHGPVRERLKLKKPEPEILTRERSGNGTPEAQRIQQDADTVQNIRREQERLRTEEADNPDLATLLRAQEHRRRTELRPEEAVPPLSERERRHALEEDRLTWEPGERHRQIALRTTSQVTAEATGGLMSAGTSNTTYFTLTVVHAMAEKWNVPVDFQLVRLALMADMLPIGHHTFHEVMTASEAFERDVLARQPRPAGAPPYADVLSYTDDWGRFRSLAPLTENTLREAMPGGRFPDEVALGLEAHERTPDVLPSPPPVRRTLRALPESELKALLDRTPGLTDHAAMLLREALGDGGNTSRDWRRLNADSYLDLCERVTRPDHDVQDPQTGVWDELESIMERWYGQAPGVPAPDPLRRTLDAAFDAYYAAQTGGPDDGTRLTALAELLLKLRKAENLLPSDTDVSSALGVVAQRLLVDQGRPPALWGEDVRAPDFWPNEAPALVRKLETAIGEFTRLQPGRQTPAGTAVGLSPGDAGPTTDARTHGEGGAETRLPRDDGPVTGPSSKAPHATSPTTGASSGTDSTQPLSPYVENFGTDAHEGFGGIHLTPIAPDVATRLQKHAYDQLPAAFHKPEVERQLAALLDPQVLFDNRLMLFGPDGHTLTVRDGRSTHSLDVRLRLERPTRSTMFETGGHAAPHNNEQRQTAAFDNTSQASTSTVRTVSVKPFSGVLDLVRGHLTHVSFQLNVTGAHQQRTLATTVTSGGNSTTLLRSSEPATPYEYVAHGDVRTTPDAGTEGTAWARPTDPLGTVTAWFPEHLRRPPATTPGATPNTATFSSGFHDNLNRSRVWGMDSMTDPGVLLREALPHFSGPLATLSARSRESLRRFLSGEYLLGALPLQRIPGPSADQGDHTAGHLQGPGAELDARLRTTDAGTWSPVLLDDDGNPVGMFRVTAEVNPRPDDASGEETRINTNFLLERYQDRVLKVDATSKVSQASGADASGAVVFNRMPAVVDKAFRAFHLNGSLTPKGAFGKQSDRTLGAGSTHNVMHNLRAGSHILVPAEVTYHVEFIGADSTARKTAPVSTTPSRIRIRALEPPARNASTAPTAIHRTAPVELARFTSIGLSTTPLSIQGAGVDTVFARAREQLVTEGYLPRTGPDAVTPKDTRTVRMQLENLRKFETYRSRSGLLTTMDELADGGLRLFFAKPSAGGGVDRVQLRLTLDREDGTDEPVEHVETLANLHMPNLSGFNVPGTTQQASGNTRSGTVGAELGGLVAGHAHMSLGAEAKGTWQTTETRTVGAGQSYSQLLVAGRQPTEVYRIPVRLRAQLSTDTVPDSTGPDAVGPPDPENSAVVHVELAVPQSRTDVSAVPQATGDGGAPSTFLLPDSTLVDVLQGGGQLRDTLDRLLSEISQDLRENGTEPGARDRRLPDDDEDFAGDGVGDLPRPATAGPAAPPRGSGLSALTSSVRGAWLSSTSVLGAWSSSLLGAWSKVEQATRFEQYADQGTLLHEVAHAQLSPAALLSRAHQMSKGTYVIDGLFVPGAFGGTDLVVEVRVELGNPRALGTPTTQYSETDIASTDSASFQVTASSAYEGGGGPAAKYGQSRPEAEAAQAQQQEPPSQKAPGPVTGGAGVKGSWGRGEVRTTTTSATTNLTRVATESGEQLRVRADVTYHVTVHHGLRSVTPLNRPGGSRTAAFTVPDGMVFLATQDQLRRGGETLTALADAQGFAPAPAPASSTPPPALPYRFLQYRALGLAAVLEATPLAEALTPPEAAPGSPQAEDGVEHHAVPDAQGSRVLHDRLVELVTRHLPGSLTPGHASYVPGLRQRLADLTSPTALATLPARGGSTEADDGARGNSLAFSFASMEGLRTRETTVRLYGRFPWTDEQMRRVEGRPAAPGGGVENYSAHAPANLSESRSRTTRSAVSVPGNLTAPAADGTSGKWTVSPTATGATTRTETVSTTRTAEDRTWQRTEGGNEFTLAYEFHAEIEVEGKGTHRLEHPVPGRVTLRFAGDGDLRDTPLPREEQGAPAPAGPRALRMTGQEVVYRISNHREVLEAVHRLAPELKGEGPATASSTDATSVRFMEQLLGGSMVLDSARMGAGMGGTVTSPSSGTPVRVSTEVFNPRLISGTRGVTVDRLRITGSSTSSNSSASRSSAATVGVSRSYGKDGRYTAGLTPTVFANQATPGGQGGGISEVGRLWGKDGRPGVPTATEGLRTYEVEVDTVVTVSREGAAPVSVPGGTALMRVSERDLIGLGVFTEPDRGGGVWDLSAGGLYERDRQAVADTIRAGAADAVPRLWLDLNTVNTRMATAGAGVTDRDVMDWTAGVADRLGAPVELALKDDDGVRLIVLAPNDTPPSRREVVRDEAGEAAARAQDELARFEADNPGLNDGAGAGADLGVTETETRVEKAQNDSEDARKRLAGAEEALEQSRLRVEKAGRRLEEAEKGHSDAAQDLVVRQRRALESEKERKAAEDALALHNERVTALERTREQIAEQKALAESRHENASSQEERTSAARDIARYNEELSLFDRQDQLAGVQQEKTLEHERRQSAVKKAEATLHSADERLTERRRVFGEEAERHARLEETREVRAGELDLAQRRLEGAELLHAHVRAQAQRRDAEEQYRRVAVGATAPVTQSLAALPSPWLASRAPAGPDPGSTAAPTRTRGERVPRPVRPDEMRVFRGTRTAEVNTERFDPRMSQEWRGGRMAGAGGRLNGSWTQIRHHVRRGRLSDGRTVRQFFVTLPFRLMDGLSSADLAELRVRVQKALDTHVNVGYRLPDSGDQLHVTVEFVERPHHGEKVTLTRTAPADGTDQDHWGVQDDDGVLVHEVLHYLGLPDEYSDGGRNREDRHLFRRHDDASGVRSSGLMVDARLNDLAHLPKDYLAIIERVSENAVVPLHRVPDSAAAAAGLAGSRGPSTDGGLPSSDAQDRQVRTSAAAEPVPKWAKYPPAGPKLLKHPSHASGDMFSVAAFLIGDPNLTVFITHDDDGRTLSHARNIQKFYMDAGIPGDRVPVVPAGHFNQRRDEFCAEKRIPKKQLLGLNDATYFVAREFTQQLREGIRDHWRVNWTDEASAETATSDGVPETRPWGSRQIEHWLASRGLTLTKDDKVAVLWTRFSGKNGEVHIEHDTSYFGISQIIERLGDFKAVVIVGDSGYSKDGEGHPHRKFEEIATFFDTGEGDLSRYGMEQRPEGFSARVLDLTEFWRDESVVQLGGNGRLAQFRLFEYLHRSSTARHIGFRSGNLEAMALMGYSVRYLEEPDSGAADRMATWHDTEYTRKWRPDDWTAPGYGRIISSRPPTRSGQYQKSLPTDDRKGGQKHAAWHREAKEVKNGLRRDKGFGSEDLASITEFLSTGDPGASLPEGLKLKMLDLDNKAFPHLHTLGDNKTPARALVDGLREFRRLFSSNEGYTHEQILRARNLYAQPVAHFLSGPEGTAEGASDSRLSSSGSFAGPSSGAPGTGLPGDSVGPEGEGSGQTSVADDVMRQLLGGRDVRPPADQLTTTIEAGTVQGRSRQSGRHTETMNVSFSRSHADERTQQSLRHLSIRLMNCIEHLQGQLIEQSEQGNEADDELAESSTRKKTQKREQEVQAAVLNNRLIFATNHNRSVDLLMQFVGEVDEGGNRRNLNDVLNLRTIDKIPYENLADGLGSDRERLYRNENARLKTRNRLDAPDQQNRTIVALAEHLERNTPVTKVDLRTASSDDLKALLTSPDERGAVILLQNTEGDNPSLDRPIHAEQKILQLLHKANLRPSDLVDSPVAIRGKKRPCFSCWMALHTFHAVPLSYNDHPGRFWKEPTESIAKHLPHLLSEMYPVNDGTPVLLESITRKLADRMYATVPSTVTPADGPSSDAGVVPRTVSGWETGSDSDAGSGDELTSPMARIALTEPRGPEVTRVDGPPEEGGGREFLPRDLTAVQQSEFLAAMSDRDRGIRSTRAENTAANAGYSQATVGHALRLINSGRASQAAVARFLGVSEVAVGKYRKRVGGDEDVPAPDPSADGRPVKDVLVEAKAEFLSRLESHPAPKKRRTGAPAAEPEGPPRLPGPNTTTGEGFWTPEVRAAFLRAITEGWTLKDLAEWLGVPPKTISNWKKNLTA